MKYESEPFTFSEAAGCGWSIQLVGTILLGFHGTFLQATFFHGFVSLYSEELYFNYSTSTKVLFAL